MVLNKKDAQGKDGYGVTVSDDDVRHMITDNNVHRYVKVSSQTEEGIPALLDIIVSESVYDCGDHMFDNTSKIGGSRRLSVEVKNKRNRKQNAACCK